MKSPKASPKGGFRNLAKTANKVRGMQLNKNEQGGASVAKRAIEREKLKQQIRNLSKRTGWKTSELIKLHKHFKLMEETMLFTHSFPTRPLGSPKVKLGQTDGLFVETFAGLESKWHPATLIESFDRESQCYRDASVSMKQVVRQVKQMTFDKYIESLHTLTTKGSVSELLHFCFQLHDTSCKGAISFDQLKEIAESHFVSSNGQQAIYTSLKRAFREECTERTAKTIRVEDLINRIRAINQESLTNGRGTSIKVNLSIDKMVSLVATEPED